MIKLLFTSAFLFLSLLAAEAQNTSSASLRWTCNQTTDLRTQAASNYNCVFVTEGTSTVRWLQRDGQVTTTYTVTGTEGAWPNVAENGSFVWLLSHDSKPGRMTAQRTAEGITITLDFSGLGDMAVKREFNVSEIQPAN